MDAIENKTVEIEVQANTQDLIRGKFVNTIAIIASIKNEAENDYVHGTKWDIGKCVQVAREIQQIFNHELQELIKNSKIA